MPDPSDLLRAAGTLLVAVVLVWFALGTQLNVRKGERTMHWLSRGLPLLGPRASIRWLGSSVVELKIVDPASPLRAAAVMVVLEPRDLGALWSFSRLRGRRDFLLVRIDLARAPRFRADLIDPTSWTARDRRRDDEPFSREQTWTDPSGREVQLRYDSDADLQPLRGYWEKLHRLSGGAWRISVRPLVPHLEVHLLLPRSSSSDARQLLATVRDLAGSVGAPR